MNFKMWITGSICVGACSLPCFAVAPPGPPFTNGDGTSANNGMKHVSIDLVGKSVSIHLAEQPTTPVTMTRGHGLDYTPDKFNVLQDVYFNAQHGWLPGGILSPPPGQSFWIKRTGIMQPPGSTFAGYEGGNMVEGMAAWTMDPIYTTDGFVWEWDGAMQHDYFTADQPGDYSMSIEVYVGDANGIPAADFMPAAIDFEFVAVPEVSAWALLLLTTIGMFMKRRR